MALSAWRVKSSCFKITVICERYCEEFIYTWNNIEVKARFQVSTDPKFRLCKNNFFFFFTKAKGDRNIYMKLIKSKQILHKYSCRLADALDFNAVIQEEFKEVSKERLKWREGLFLLLQGESENNNKKY